MDFTGNRNYISLIKQKKHHFPNVHTVFIAIELHLPTNLCAVAAKRSLGFLNAATEVRFEGGSFCPVETAQLIVGKSIASRCLHEDTNMPS